MLRSGLVPSAHGPGSMISDRLDQLTDYPFPRLDALLAGMALPEGVSAANPMWIGEPKHAVPDLVKAPLATHFADYNRYPPIEGTPGLREAIAAWLQRRYGLADGFVGAHDGAIMPVAGSREGLFLIAHAAVPETKAGGRPVAIVPNPFYQPYKGGAVTAGAEMFFPPCTRETDFLPDLDAIPAAVLDRTAIFYLCSPANPQGTVASRDYLRRAVALARKHDFLLVSDECYAEIYDRTPPPGALEICAETGSLSNVVVSHSLSKRSSAAGLRSGFMAGDPAFLKAFVRLRKYAAASSSFATYAAAEALWRDEAHVTVNRDLYRAKIDVAERILGNRFGFYRPPGGFFLWLEVGDGEAAAKRLWSEAGVKVLPGAYLAALQPGEPNEATSYIRVALVNDLETTRAGLAALAATL